MLIILCDVRFIYEILYLYTYMYVLISVYFLFLSIDITNIINYIFDYATVRNLYYIKNATVRNYCI